MIYKPLLASKYTSRDRQKEGHDESRRGCWRELARPLTSSHRLIDCEEVKARRSGFKTCCCLLRWCSAAFPTAALSRQRGQGVQSARSDTRPGVRLEAGPAGWILVWTPAESWKGRMPGTVSRETWLPLAQHGWHFRVRRHAPQRPLECSSRTAHTWGAPGAPPFREYCPGLMQGESQRRRGGVGRRLSDCTRSEPVESGLPCCGAHMGHSSCPLLRRSRFWGATMSFRQHSSSEIFERT